jgi:hypothetical protein
MGCAAQKASGGDDAGCFTEEEPTVEEVADDIATLNPAVKVKELLGKRLQRNEDGSLNSWDLSNLGLTDLPESLAVLIFSGDVSFAKNSLKELPQSFGFFEVGGELVMYCNELSHLPDSIGNLTVIGPP